MFSRIQTIFLFIAGLALSLSFIFPIAEIAVGESKAYYTNYGLQSVDAAGKTTHTSGGIIYLVAAAGLLLILIALTQFKRRKIQILICRITYLVILTHAVLCFLLPESMVQTIKFAGEIKITSSGLGFYLPIVAVVSTFLAELFIKRDEKLVRSADRLR